MILALLRQPLPLALTWMLLHAADFFLTLRGARLFHRAMQGKLDVGGSYELNPLFEKAIDQEKLPRRFWVTLFGMAALLALVAWAVAVIGEPWLVQVLDLLIGVLVFTRLAVIANHLNNLWLFGNVARDPALMQGQVKYARWLTYGLSAARWFASMALVGVAAACVPSAFLAGGALGLALVGLKHALLAGRARRAPQPQPAPPAA